jgi:D-alanine-D-alanine ligase
MDMERRPRVGVLYGGISAEREISLKSGDAVAKALGETGYPAELFDIRDVPLGSLGLESMDVAFIALHGTFGEDGGIQCVLDVLGVPYTGSGVRASRLAMDKVASKLCFRQRGLATPRFVEIEAAWPEERKLAAARSIGFPLILKPACQGSSVGVTFVRTERRLSAAVAMAFEFDDRAIAESYIAGRELTVGILDDHPLPIIELLFDGPVFSYDIKYRKGAARHVVNPDLPHGLAERVQDIALAAHRGLGCRGCTRVDLRLSRDDQPFLLEVNTIPGMTETSLLPDAAAAAGMSFAELCELAVDMALRIGPRGVSTHKRRSA